jgi:type II secretory pathway component PulK
MVTRRRHRVTSASRGYILLASLAIIVVLSAVCATIAVSLDTATRARQIDTAQRLADDLLLGADRLIDDWLTRYSRSVVLPPDVAEPLVAVHDGGFSIAGLRCHIRVTARDLMGDRPNPTAGAPVLNVNSATAPLLRDLFTAAGRDDVHHVLIARSKGRPAPIVGSLALPGARSSVRLVGSSEAWTTNTEIAVDGLIVRWQAMYKLEHGVWVLQSRRRVT